MQCSVKHSRVHCFLYQWLPSHFPLSGNRNLVQTEQLSIILWAHSPIIPRSSVLGISTGQSEIPP